MGNLGESTPLKKRDSPREKPDVNTHLEHVAVPDRKADVLTGEEVVVGRMIVELRAHEELQQRVQEYRLDH